MKIRKLLLIIVFALILCPTMQAQDESRKEASQQLGMALEYFTSGKYHEALLMFEKLNGKYRLNPRYMAFMGSCYYYEWKYDKAIECFDKSLPQLSGFAPHERSFYYWASAESHFYMKRYKEAIPLYDTMLTLCYDNEKPDAFYQLGFCYYFEADNQKAHDKFVQALSLYESLRPEKKSRIVQLRNMIKGLEAE